MKKFLHYFILLFVIFIPKLLLAAGYIGIDFGIDDNQLIVAYVHSKSPAYKARIKEGDLIQEINGQPVNTIYEFMSMLLEAEAGDRWNIVLDRNGKTKTVNVNLWKMDISPEELIIHKLIWKEENVVLVNILLGINLIAPASESKLSEWKEATRNMILAKQESKYAELSTEHSNFYVVDRAHLDKVLTELNLSECGYISGEMRKKIGSLLGVTHILGVTYSKTPLEEGSWDEVWTRKLIEVESGKILAVGVIEQKFDTKGRLEESIKNWEKEPTGRTRRIRYSHLPGKQTGERKQFIRRRKR